MLNIVLLLRKRYTGFAVCHAPSRVANSSLEPDGPTHWAQLALQIPESWQRYDWWRRMQRSAFHSKLPANLIGGACGLLGRHACCEQVGHCIASRRLNFSATTFLERPIRNTSRTSRSKVLKEFPKNVHWWMFWNSACQNRRRWMSHRTKNEWKNGKRVGYQEQTLHWRCGNLTNSHWRTLLSTKSKMQALRWRKFETVFCRISWRYVYWLELETEGVATFR